MNSSGNQPSSRLSTVLIAAAVLAGYSAWPETASADGKQSVRAARVYYVPPEEVVQPITICQDDAACDDGEFCNGQEVCTNGVCGAGPPPCDQPAVCDEVHDACVINDPAAAICSVLGDSPPGKADEDTFLFQGHAGEAVSVEIQGDGDGVMRLRLIGFRDEEEMEPFELNVAGQPPLLLTAVLPWSAPYHVVVRQPDPKKRKPADPYVGDYCVVIESNGDAASTLAPGTDVESDENAAE
jgi:hypothetical protein